MPAALVGLVIALVYVLHQDVWLWRSARPLVFGFLPAGLAYHAGYTIAISLLMLILVKYRWPSHLEDDANERPRVRHASGVGPGAAASERAGGTGGAKPPGKK